MRGHFLRAALAASVAYDADAQAYITAVEAADAASLETAVMDAINNFVVGCKADGIWTAIKASCILAGARTLTGALVPLVGTAPTNVNFVSGDYNRKTGLIGDGATKYLNSGRAQNADPLNNVHLAVYASTSVPTTNNTFIGAGPFDGTLMIQASTTNVLFRANNGGGNFIGVVANDRFYGVSRNASGSYIGRNGTSSTFAVASTFQSTDNISILARGALQQGGHRVAFYSIGESLDLALLEARVTTLINAYAAAIP